MTELTLADFHEEDGGSHQWVYNDRELKLRYAIRKIDSVYEMSIRDELTSDPRPEDEKVVDFLIAVNAHRANKGLADRRSKQLE